MIDACVIISFCLINSLKTTRAVRTTRLMTNNYYCTWYYVHNL